MMKKSKKNLLVTLADKNYVRQAKQLFSSVYFNAGWKEDYMLLVYKIPEKELEWFREKGILIREVKPEKFFKFKKEWIRILSPDKNNLSPAAQREYVLNIWHVTACKFFLFTPYFKRWKNIIYLDSDIIVRGPLDQLTKIRGFAACLDYNSPKLIKQFVAGIRWITRLENGIIKVSGNRINNKLITKLKKIYNLEDKTFNSGVFAFSTDIITNKTFSTIKDLFDLYGEFSFKGSYEQGLINLLFYKKWVALPMVYNIYAHYLSRILKIKPEKLKAINLHFVMKKPWDNKNEKDYFYEEWVDSLEKANLINLKKPRKPKKWSNWKIKSYSSYLKTRCFLYSLKKSLRSPTYLNYIDSKIGLLGIRLKNHYPETYYYLKKKKNILHN